MKISHFITLHMGSGPMSLVEIDGRMLRITHNARFEKTKEVDPDQAREMIKRLPHMREASTEVQAQHAAMLTQEVLSWMVRTCELMAVPQAIRWLPDGSALTFRTEAEALDHDARADKPAALPQTPKRRRTMMGG